MELIEDSIFPDRPPVVYANFGQRFVASLLDGLILIIPAVVLKVILGNVGQTLSMVLYWLYYAFQESGPNQATIGKKAMGLIVTDVDGGRISFGQATGRFFGRYISVLILFIGYFMNLWDDRGQTLHDKMAGTLVVKKW